MDTLSRLSHDSDTEVAMVKKVAMVFWMSSYLCSYLIVISENFSKLYRLLLFPWD